MATKKPTPQTEALKSTEPREIGKLMWVGFRTNDKMFSCVPSDGMGNVLVVFDADTGELKEARAIC